MNSAHPKPCARVASWAPVLELATREVFDLMVGSTLENAPEQTPGEELDITSVVGLAGELCGVLTLRCAASTAREMAAAMLGVAADSAGDEMWDAVGEVCNMIAGNFKNKLAGMGDGCLLSVPTVFVGSNYAVHSLAEDSRIQIGFVFKGALLLVSLELQN